MWNPINLRRTPLWLAIYTDDDDQQKGMKKWSSRGKTFTEKAEILSIALHTRLSQGRDHGAEDLSHIRLWRTNNHQCRDDVKV